MDVIEMGVTVTEHVAVFEPSTVVTVMVEDPSFTAVTLPFTSTVATVVLLEDQVTVLSVAFEGDTVAVKVSVPPMTSVIDVLFKLTLVTVTGFTVTTHCTDIPPAVAVIVAVPTPFAVTVPLDTVATEVLELLHVTVLSVAFVGATVAVRVSEVPFTRLKVVLFKVTPVTATLLTVTVQVAVTPLPSWAVAVIVAVPALTPVTTPLELTVATDVLELDQVTALSAALLGVTVAVKVVVAPTLMLAVVLFSVMPLTRMGVTVTAQVADFPPAVAVIVAVPTPFAVTVPLDTVATEVLELLHVTVLSVASVGATVATSASVAPTAKVASDLFREILDTGTENETRIGLKPVLSERAIVRALVEDFVNVFPCVSRTTKVNPLSNEMGGTTNQKDVPSSEVVPSFTAGSQVKVISVKVL